jgi:hypothetical protein
MHPKPAKAELRFLRVAVLIALAIATAGPCLGGSYTPRPKPPVVIGKNVILSLDGKPWKEVFRFLAEVTGKPVARMRSPAGSFTLAGPEQESYTVPEFLDIVNAGLLSDYMEVKYVLLDREWSFVLWPAEDVIEEALMEAVAILHR